MWMKDNIITIDGPSASGKGTLARNIAKYLGFEILDSGLLYRIYAYLYDSGVNHTDISQIIIQDISFKFKLLIILLTSFFADPVSVKIVSFFKLPLIDNKISL